MRRQQGLTAIETLLALAAGALAVLGAVVLYNAIMLNMKVNQSFEILNLLSTSVRKVSGVGGSTNSFSGASASLDFVSMLVRTNEVPGVVIHDRGADANNPDDDVIMTPWRKPIEVTAYPNTFTVTFNDLDQAACFRLLVKTFERDRRILRGVKIGGQCFGYEDEAGGACGDGPLPVPIDQAQAICAEDGTLNDITWVFE